MIFTLQYDKVKLVFKSSALPFVTQTRNHLVNLSYTYPNFLHGRIGNVLTSTGTIFFALSCARAQGAYLDSQIFSLVLGPCFFSFLSFVPVFYFFPVPANCSPPRDFRSRPFRLVVAGLAPPCLLSKPTSCCVEGATDLQR